jgi:hypothetical protein
VTSRAGFSLDTGHVLTSEPRAGFDAGVVYGVAGPAAWDERLEPHVGVAWLEEAPGVTLADAVREDLARLLSRPDAVLLDRQSVALGGLEFVRTFVAEVGPSGVPTASEQWRTVAGGRRWTVSVTTTLADQPDWGPRLAAVVATFQPG